MTPRPVQQATPRLPGVQPRSSLSTNSSATPLTTREIQLFPVAAATRPRPVGMPRTRGRRPFPWRSAICLAVCLAGMAASSVAYASLQNLKQLEARCKLS